MAQPSATDVHTEATGFKCSSCGGDMHNWADGSSCDKCRNDKVSKYAPNQARDNKGRFTSSGGSVSSSEEADIGTVNEDAYYYARNHGFSHADAIASSKPRHPHRGKFLSHLLDGARAYGNATSGVPVTKESAVPTALTPMFKCSSCGHGMDDWKAGSVCVSCRRDNLTKAAAAAAAVKPGAGAVKNPKAGAVQDEFPKCPRCGTPTKDGTVCDDCRKTVDREHEGGDLTLAQQKAQAERDEADSKEEEERRGIRGKARAAMARMLGLDVSKATEVLKSAPPTVLKSSAAARFSYAPMYMPGTLDAHDEFVKSADDLQRATWDYVEKTGASRDVFLQHIDKAAGKWVEITSWPYAVEAPMRVPGTDIVRKASLPAGTVYMGVIWEPWAWEMVQKGRLLGFSMGGWAKRVQAELADESVTKSAGNGETWTRAGVVNPQSPALGQRLPYNEHEARKAFGLPVE